MLRLINTIVFLHIFSPWSYWMLNICLVFSVPIANTFHTVKAFLNKIFHNVKCHSWIPLPTCHPETSVEREFSYSLKLLQSHNSDLPLNFSSIVISVFWILKLFLSWFLFTHLLDSIHLMEHTVQYFLRNSAWEVIFRTCTSATEFCSTFILHWLLV